VAQADFGHNLKPAPAAKLFVFSDFFDRFGFPESAFCFLHLKATLCGAKPTTVVASKFRFARQLKSTSVFKSHLKVRSARHKVDFGRI
jgi:hypothetical protein